MRLSYALAGLIVLLLLAIAACAEAMRRRGRDRPPAAEYYRGPGPWLAPLNLWAVTRGAEPDTPFPTRDVHFPRSAVLRSAWREIAAEAQAIVAAGKATPIGGDLFFRRIADARWKKFYIKWHGPVLADAATAAPLTAGLIATLPEVRVAMFSVLEPGARIPPHEGPYAGCVRYHLTLACATAAGKLASIRVDGTPYYWRPGEDVLFDDTYRHSVENPTAETRIVLFCDVDRAMATAGASRAVKAISAALGPLTARANDRNEKSATPHPH